MADEFNDKTLAVADFLREHDVDVICVVHQTFKADGGPHLLTTEAVRRPIRVEPTGTETSAGPSEPTTESGKQRMDFWERVNEGIGQRQNSSLDNGWQPQNYTWQNIAFPATQVPLQVACKTRDEVVEARLIVRDDRERYEALSTDRRAVQKAIEDAFGGAVDSGFEFEWISPDESTASKERGKLVWRRPIDLARERSRRECARWTVDAAEAFYDVFTDQFDVSDLS